MYQETAKLRTKSRVFYTTNVALDVINKLVNQSQWFVFEPLPGDTYEIIVKEENEHMLYPVLERA